MSGDTHPLDIGIVSYGNPEGLSKLLESIRAQTHTQYRIIVVVNPHPDSIRSAEAEEVLHAYQPMPHGPMEFHKMEENIGYAKGVNHFLHMARTPYVAYFDHDATIRTNHWNERMSNILDQYHEVGMVFPNGGSHPINRGTYLEILWGVGCAWMMRRPLVQEVGYFDTELGHHEEVDYQTRVRLAGYKIVAQPAVGLWHAARASLDPTQHERIATGVRKWVDKWCAYFGGRHLNYHSANVLRHEDWTPSALYLEEYWKSKFPGLNEHPEEVTVDGVEYDLIKVPRLKGFYRHRII